MESLQSMFTNSANNFTYDICPPSSLVTPLPPLEAVTTCLSTPVSSATIPLTPGLPTATLSPTHSHTTDPDNMRDSNSTENTTIDAKDYIDNESQSHDLLTVASTTVTATLTNSTIATLVTMKRTRADGGTVVDPKKPFRCEVCRKSFSRKSNLTNHQHAVAGESASGDVKHFFCSYCDRCFPIRARLRDHQRVHTGERPHACVLCGRAFSHPSNLRTHLRTHSGEKPYQCPVCRKAFGHHSNLKTHVRIHTGERPYVCVLCSKGFSHQTNLKDHERTHTGESQRKSAKLK